MQNCGGKGRGGEGEKVEEKGALSVVYFPSVKFKRALGSRPHIPTPASFPSCKLHIAHPQLSPHVSNSKY